MRKKIILFCFLSVLLILCMGMTNGLTMKNMKTSSMQINENQNHGSYNLCILGIETNNVEGLPDDEMYAGVLTDVDATLDGAIMFGIVPIPWMIFATGFHTNQTIHLKMDFFWGAIDPVYEDTTMMAGFARNLEWEW